MGDSAPVRRKGAIDAIEKGTKLTTAVLKRRHATNVSAEATLKQHAKIKGKSEKNKEPVHAVTQGSDSESDDTFIGTTELNTVSAENTNIIWVTPEIENKPLKMELDTGSAVSIIPATTYEKLFKTKKLRKTDVILKTYSGEKLSPKGMLQVHVKYGEKTQELPLYVVNGNGPPLLGRDWLTHMKLNWNEIKLLRTTNITQTETHKRLEQILKKYRAVFQDQMGTI